MKSKRMNNWNSGTLAGIFGAVCLQPFDVLKTYSILSEKERCGMMTGFRVVINKYGIRGMWRGGTAAISRAMLGSGSYFSLLEEFKFLFNSTNIAVLGMCSGLAKISVTTLCQPISIIKVRMEAPSCQIYTGFLDAFIVIYKSEGIRGYYKGLVPAIIKDTPYSTLGYMFYEKYIELFSHLTYSNRANPIVTFISGVFAGFTATIITQPFDVIKTRIQCQKINGGNYENMYSSIQTIYKEDGLPGFQRGLWPRIAKRFFSFPLVWTIYEQIKLRL